MKLTLKIVTQGQEEIVELNSRRSVTLGREGAVRIEDGHCSREHAEIRIDENGRLLLSDLGSRNGTFVNGKLVKKALLAGDELIQLGRARIQLIANAQPAQAEIPLVVHTWPELLQCR